MNEKKMMKWRKNVRGTLLIIAMTSIVLAATHSVAYAATEPKAAAASVSVRPVTILDPFTLSTLTVSNPQTVAKPAAAPSVMFVRPNKRHVVHIPPNPPVRSAFRPNL